MSKRDQSLLIEDIIESASKVLSYTEHITFEQFIIDTKTVDAVIRNFEIIGEAANRLSESYKELHPNIDWFRIRGFRNRIVHDYFGIDYSIVLEIKKNFLSKLILSLKSL